MKNVKVANKSYHQQKDLLTKEVAALKRSVDKFSFLRLVVFIVAIFLIYLFFSNGFAAVFIICCASLIVFLILVKKQISLQNIHQFKVTQLKLIENEISVQKGFPNIYINGESFENPQHAYTDDLDVFGKHSLFAYVNRCATILGIDLLAKWFTIASSKVEIEQRQQAVSELTYYKKETLDFRTRLFSLDKNLAQNLSDFFNDKLIHDIKFINSNSAKTLIILGPLVTISSLIMGFLFNGVFWNILGLSLFISVIWYITFKIRIDKIHEKIDKSAGFLKSYSLNLLWIESVDWKSEILQAAKKSMKSDKCLHLEIDELSKIVGDLNYRLNMVVGTFMNLFFQWDLHCIKKLAKWQKRNVANLNNGFKTIAEFESLISFAILSENHPYWVNPKILDSYHFEALALGHPLIPMEKRINNNFVFSNNKTVDVITGSNMAGKSTFLRTVGINMILAFSGAKVCAGHFETSIFNLLSYMRIKDSLSDHTSTFKAEIDRLKMILDFTVNNPNSLVLVDEMLRGTNSKDKYLGTKVFIKKLISDNTPAFIATHDLQIAELERDYPSQIRNYHFDIQMHDQKMFFDYRIKDGECKTFNATILLKAIGLELEN